MQSSICFLVMPSTRFDRRWLPGHARPARRPFMGLAQAGEPVVEERATARTRSPSSVFIAARKASPPGSARTAQPMCLRALRTPRLAVQRVVVLQVLGQPLRTPRPRWPAASRPPVARKCATSRKIHGRPWRRGRSSARRRRCAPARRAPCGRVDVAVGHHRDAQRGLHGGRGVVLGQALVALLARAAVHGDQGDAGVLRARAPAPARCARCRTSRCASSASPARPAARRRRPRHRRWRAPAARCSSAPNRPTRCTPSWPGSPC
jgi:hypothetical protein